MATVKQKLTVQKVAEGAAAWWEIGLGKGLGGMPIGKDG